MSDERVRALERAWAAAPNDLQIRAQYGRELDRAGITIDLRKIMRTVPGDIEARPGRANAPNNAKAWAMNAPSSLDAWLTCEHGSFMLWPLAKFEGASKRLRAVTAECLNVAFQDKRFNDRTRSLLAQASNMAQDLAEATPSYSARDRQMLNATLNYEQEHYDRNDRNATINAVAVRAAWFATLSDSEFKKNAQWIPSTIAAALASFEAEISTASAEYAAALTRYDAVLADAVRRVVPIPYRT